MLGQEGLGTRLGARYKTSMVLLLYGLITQHALPWWKGKFNLADMIRMIVRFSPWAFLSYYNLNWEKWVFM